jgi:hypothetical protein
MRGLMLDKELGWEEGRSVPRVRDDYIVERGVALAEAGETYSYYHGEGIGCP